MTLTGRRWVIAVGFVAAALATGCGSESANPPPAEPATSPPLAEAPAGKVIRGSSEAEGVAVDPRSGLAAVSYLDPDRIELIETASGRVVKRITTPGPARHLSLARPGGPILAPIEYADLLLEVSLPNGEEKRVSVGDFPHDAAAASDGRIFVTDEGGDTISVVDGNTVEIQLPASEQPGGVAVDGDTVAVVAVAAREIDFLNATSLRQVATVEGGAGPSHVVAADGRFYVADTGGDALLVYEGGEEPRLVDRANVPGSPYGIAVDPRRERIWVTQTARNRVVEMEMTDLAPKIVRGYPTVRQPNGIAVDPRTGTVIVVGRDRGDVQIIKPEVAGDGHG